MTNTTSIVPGLLALPLLAGALALQPARAQDKPMTAAEIQSELVGKKLFVRAGNGNLVDYVMRADGNAELAGNGFTDTGKWRPTEDGYCVTWVRIGQGKERCFRIVRRGDSRLVVSADGAGTTSTILRVTD